MNIRSLIIKASCCAALFILGSCGDTNPGPRVAVFNTATVTANITTALTPINVFPSGACTNGALTTTSPVGPQSATVTITSSPFPTTTTTTGTPTAPPTPQQIVIYAYTISYAPVDGGPAITDPVQHPLSTVLPAGGGAGIPTPTITLANSNAIAQLQADPVLKLCTPHSYTYNVFITFYGTELGGSNASFTIGTPLEFINGL